MINIYSFHGLKCIKIGGDGVYCSRYVPLRSIKSLYAQDGKVVIATKASHYNTNYLWEELEESFQEESFQEELF